MLERLHAAHEPLHFTNKETKIQVLVNFDAIKVSLYSIINLPIFEQHDAQKTINYQQDQICTQTQSI